MPNYFDYINESAVRYDEPEFVEESVNDSFNETIADMDLHCFQESLIVGAIIIGAVALIGLLIVIMKKIINGSSGGNGGMKKQAAKMEKTVNDLSRKGVREIRTGDAAREFINSSNFKRGDKSIEETKPVPTNASTSKVIQIEEVLCDGNKEFVDILDVNTADSPFMKAMESIFRFVEGTRMYFDYAIAKKDGRTKGARHMPDKWRTGTDESGKRKYADEVKGFKYEDIFEPLNLPLREMNTCLVRKNIISIDSIRDTVGKIKNWLIPEAKAALNKLNDTERKLKKYGEDGNDNRAFQNKMQESKYRKNVADSNKFVQNSEIMNNRSILWLEKCNGSARFVGQTT